MKSKFIRIINLIVAVAVFVLAIGYAFAWLSESRKEAEQNFDGSSGQTYFAGGDGSAEYPYIINDKYHLYNLAWLQNTGKFRKKLEEPEQTKYYFKLEADIEITDNNFWLPPIGTDDNPFIGDFNGNGHKISGLKITTDTSKLIGLPSGYTTFSNAVGMFGMTEKGPGTVDNITKIHNFILDNPIVEVATQNAPYSTGIKDSENKPIDTNVAGLAIGYLNTGCKAYSIGILSPESSTGAKLDLQRQNCKYSTFNSIIGALAKDATSSVTGGGHVSGGGDKGIFYPVDIHSKVNTTNSSFGSVNENGEFEFNGDLWITKGSSDALGLGSLSFTTSRGESNTKTQLREANTKTPSQFKYYSRTDTAGSGIEYSSQCTSKLVYLNENASANQINDDEANLIKAKVKDTSGNQITELSYSFYTGAESKFMNDRDVQLYDSDGTVLKDENDVAISAKKYNIYARSIKVNVVTDNAKIFVVAGCNNTSSNRKLCIYKATDGENTNYTADYSKPESFVVDSGEDTGHATEQASNAYQTLAVDVADRSLVACEFDLSKTTKNGKTEGGKGAYIIGSSLSICMYYVSIQGIEGGNAGSATGAIENDKDVSAVDFIYNGVSISQEEKTDEKGNKVAIGNFIVNTSGDVYNLYAATQTSVYFEKLNLALKIAFLRKAVSETETKTLDVTVTGTTDNTKVTATDRNKVEWTFNAT